MTELTEIDVMRAMVRAGIGKVGAYSIDMDRHVSGRCKHKVHEFSHNTDTVSWRPKGWAGCALCIITCSAILEDPDMPTESEELELRADLAPAHWPLSSPITFVGILLGSLAFGAFLAL